jgi:epoxyqueuosine reductase
VCPWNRRAPVTREEEFQPRSTSAKQKDAANGGELPGDDSLFLPRLEWLASLSEEEYREVFRGSPVKRTKWRGLVRNACIALGNSSLPRGTVTHQRISTLLARLAASPDAPIAESARWAFSRIQ